MADKRRLTIYEDNAPTEKVIEKSRFITYSAHVESEEEARVFLAALKAEHPFATHICYAFIADKQGNLQRFSDDNEPQGTAGLPILENLKRLDLVYTAVAVVRYFGGVKLGVGGLTRAYFSAAKEHLDGATICEIVPCESWEVVADYSAAEGMEKLMKRYGGEVEKVEYLERVHFFVQVKLSDSEHLRSKVVDFSCGKEEIKVLEQKDGYFPFLK